MASKLQLYQFIAEQAAKEITAMRGNWTDFLDTAAKMYKHSFPDQLLIHAQRPDATVWSTADEAVEYPIYHMQVCKKFRKRSRENDKTERPNLLNRRFYADKPNQIG